MNNEQRRKYYQHDLESIKDAHVGNCYIEYGETCSLNVGDFLEDLWEEGYVVLPRTYVGSHGWTPEELYAYQCGIMAVMTNVKEMLESDKIAE